MQKAAKPNWDQRRVRPDFPYLRTLMRGCPARGTDPMPGKHPRMDIGHRAKIFAPFDALDGFSALIRQQDCLREEPAPEKTEENICEFWEEP